MTTVLKTARLEADTMREAMYRQSTRSLEQALRLHHADLSIVPNEAPAVVEPSPPPSEPAILPPIHNQQMKVANEIIGDTSPPLPKQPTIREIQDAVCDHFGISRMGLLSDRRTRKLVRPRQVGIYLCRKLTTRSYPQIAEKFGKRDHTTALAAIWRIEKLIPVDCAIREAVESLTGMLEQR